VRAQNGQGRRGEACRRSDVVATKASSFYTAVQCRLAQRCRPATKARKASLSASRASAPRRATAMGVLCPLNLAVHETRTAPSRARQHRRSVTPEIEGRAKEGKWTNHTPSTKSDLTICASLHPTEARLKEFPDGTPTAEAAARPRPARGRPPPAEPCLVEERHAEQEGDPAEARIVTELAEKRLALVEQAPTLIEIRLIEAEDSKCPLDLALVVSFAGDLQALAGVLPRHLALAQIRRRERGGAERIRSQPGVEVSRARERRDEPRFQLPQAGSRPQGPERSYREASLPLHVARSDEPPTRASDVVELVPQPDPRLRELERLLPASAATSSTRSRSTGFTTRTTARPGASTTCAITETARSSSSLAPGTRRLPASR
jgi:hypothetical protein